MSDLSIPLSILPQVAAAAFLAVGCGLRNETIGGGDGLTVTFTSQGEAGFDGTVTIDGVEKAPDPMRPQKDAWVSLQVGDYFTVRGVPTGDAIVTRTRLDGTTEDVTLGPVEIFAFANDSLGGHAVLEGLPSLELGAFETQTWSDDFRSGSATTLVEFNEEDADPIEETEISMEWSFTTELASWRASRGGGSVVEPGG